MVTAERVRNRGGTMNHNLTRGERGPLARIGPRVAASVADCNIRQFARKVSGVLADWDYAQRRLAELRLSPEQYVFKQNAPPLDYAEFLYRTSSVLRHERSARAGAKLCPDPELQLAAFTGPAAAGPRVR
jgi:hypothetical protein